MSFYTRNIKRSIFAHPKVNLVILVNLTLTTSVVFILLQNFYYLKERHYAFFYEDKIARTYQIKADRELGGIVESDLHNKTSMYDIGLQLYKNINASELKTFNINSTSIAVNGLDEETKRKIKQVTNKSILDAYGFSEYALEGMELKISEGRWFNEFEYNSINEVEMVPIIMGTNYAGIFNIGDIISCSDEKLQDKAIVIGFIEEDAVIDYYGTEQFVFDDAVIMTETATFPRTELNRLSDEAINRERVRTLTDGYIFCSNDKTDVQKEINHYTSQYGFYALEVLPIDGQAYSETKTISERNLFLIGVLAIVITIICLISMCGTFYNRSLDDLRTNSIYMSVGIPLWKINLSIILEMLFWIALSIIPVISISLHEFNAMKVPIWQMVLFECIVTAISIAPTLSLNKKNIIGFLIKNQS